MASQLAARRFADERYASAGSSWVDPALIGRYVTELARHGAFAEGGVSRLVYSPEWVAAQETIAIWCRDAGLTLERDAVGNVWGKLGDTRNAPLIVTGSHVDSQRCGGQFDGALGIVAGLVALQTLKERFGEPQRPLAVVSLAEEEASRFPTANFWGSRAIVGRIAPQDPDEVLDFDGRPIAEAMRDAGLDPAQASTARRDDIAAFIELHIEQGPLLEQASLSVGVVERITGYRQYTVHLEGEANHAGTTPMDLRRDPMRGAAEIIIGVIDTAERMGRPAVTTAGRILAEPNARSVVPLRISFTIDARHPDADALDFLCRLHEQRIAEVARRRYLDLRITVDSNRRPCPCDPELVGVLREAAAAANVPTMTMASGAVHDAQQLSALCPVAMLFVQNRGGLSHTPAEYTALEHAVAGTEVLTRALYRLAYCA